jgi:tetratricopeptide (TPR) repeat protein
MAGDRIRISANLIDASKEKHIWSEEYERDFKDILSLQKNVAKAVADEISLQLTPQDELTLNKSQQVDPEAYKSYLKGIQYYREFKWQKAMACFDSTIAKDPDFGPAYAENLKIYCINGNPLSLEKAKNVADKLLNDYADLPEAQIALTVYYSFIEGRFDLAEQSIKKAIELNPGNSEAHREYGLLLSRMTDNYKKSLQELNEAKKLDPLYPEIYTNIAEIYILQGQYEKAIQEIQTPKEINPDFKMNAALLGWIYVLQGNIDEGINLLESRPGSYASVIQMSVKAMIGYAYAIQGKRQIALTYLNKSIEKENYKNAAFICFGLNEIEEGLKYLQKAFDASPYSQKLFIAQVDSYPFWKPFKKNDKFKSFVNKKKSML